MNFKTGVTGARCKRHNYCSQSIPSIAEQFDNADQSLFRTVLYTVSQKRRHYTLVHIFAK